MTATPRVIVIGAGVGGLAAALMTAARGCDTLVLEAADAPGGKLSELDFYGQKIDVGPTVFTMRDVFEDLFASAGVALGDVLKLKRAGRLARHAWADGSRLDLYDDVEANVAAIGEFAGANAARGYRDFAARSARICGTLDGSFMRASRPNMVSLAARVGFVNLRELAAITPFETLWRALGGHFEDAKLRQLFARYATYCGSSPFAAPATLMLVAHVEREGVWYVEGGMRRLADALVSVAERSGARFRFRTRVARVVVEGGRVRGVVTQEGERLEADAVVFNGDVSALGASLLGEAAQAAAAPTPPAGRSLSAITFAGLAVAEGFPLIRHNVFFGGGYAQEFEAIFRRGQLPAEPTVYVCASDREDESEDGREPQRLFCLVNAPAEGARSLGAEEIETCKRAATDLMRRSGLTLDWTAMRTTTPADFAARFPATGGALYGPATHGWRASFLRAGSRSKLPGLYLAGGSSHPGPGVPMAALSGRQAALSLMQDLASTRRLFPAAMPGGTSMRSATTGATD